MLMDVIPLDASLVTGTHGRVPEDRNEYPIVNAPGEFLAADVIDSPAIYNLLKVAVNGGPALAQF
jgi:hypothetical protein